MFRKGLWFLVSVGVLIAAGCIAINLHITSNMSGVLKSEIEDLHDAEFGIVLGAGTRRGNPSDILKDRLDSALQAYSTGKFQKFLLTGDNITEGAYEVAAMKKYLIERGVDEGSIILDNNGVSTYTSMQRAWWVYKVRNAIVFTQDFHLPRSVYIARSFGIETQGFISDRSSYLKIDEFKMREFFARIKAFWQVRLLEI